MFILGLGMNFSTYNLSNIEFRYNDVKVSGQPSTNSTPFGFEFYGTYNFKESPLFLGGNLGFYNGSLNTTWDVYGFEFRNTTKINITKIKFLVGLYAPSKSYIFQAGIAPQVWSLKLTGDNGSSSGSSIGLGFFGDILLLVSKQIYISIGAFYDYIPSITTTYSQDSRLKIILNTNQSLGFGAKFAFSLM